MNEPVDFNFEFEDFFLVNIEYLVWRYKTVNEKHISTILMLLNAKLYILLQNYAF